MLLQYSCASQASTRRNGPLRNGWWNNVLAVTTMRRCCTLHTKKRQGRPDFFFKKASPAPEHLTTPVMISLPSHLDTCICYFCFELRSTCPDHSTFEFCMTSACTSRRKIVDLKTPAVKVARIVGQRPLEFVRRKTWTSKPVRLANGISAVTSLCLCDEASTGGEKAWA